MSTSTSQATRSAPQCPRCQTPRPAGIDWEDFCPSCLLTMALAVDEGPCAYEVIAPMAEDAAGVTYLAQQRSGARASVALKIYQPRADVAAVLDRFARWKPRLDAFTHPRVSRLLEVGVTEAGRLFKVSEYAPGFSVRALGPERLARGSTAIELARQLAGTVAAVHAAHLAHLALDVDRLKVTMSQGPQLTLLGVGVWLVVEGDEGDGADTRNDLAPLRALLQRLGITLPAPSFDSAAAIVKALG